MKVFNWQTDEQNLMKLMNGWTNDERAGSKDGSKRIKENYFIDLNLFDGLTNRERLLRIVWCIGAVHSVHTLRRLGYVDQNLFVM